MSNLDNFLRGYAEAILWADAYAYDEDGELETDESATYVYITPGKWWESIGIDLSDATDFYYSQCATMGSVNVDYSQHGHDFALTRNGHGAGFWDRGYGEVGERLSDAARAYGEHHVITNDGPTVENI